MKYLLFFVLLFAGLVQAAQHAPKKLPASIQFSTTINDQGYHITIAENLFNVVGSISYVPHNSYNDMNEWRIGSLSVQIAARKQSIGTHLFAVCLDTIKQKKGALVSWDVLPLDTSLNTEQLIAIYDKMIARAGFAPSQCTIKENEFFTRMALTLN